MDDLDSGHSSPTEDRILAEVCRAIGRASDPSDAVQSASETLQHFFPTTAFGIWLLMEEGRLELTVSIFDPGVPEEVRDDIRGRFARVSLEDDLPGPVAIRTGRSVRYSRGDPDLHEGVEAALVALGADWVCGIPLEAETEKGPAGAAFLMGPEGTQPGTEEENVLKAALGQLALLARAIRLSHQQEELRVLNAAVEHLPALLAVIDPDWTIRRVNPEAERILGYPTEEIVGQKVHVLSAESEELERALEGAVRKGGWVGELRHRHKDGRSVEMYTVAASAFDEEGNLEGVLMISRDLTEEKLRDDKALQAYRLAAVGELAAGVAHEVNNPLTSIHSLAALLSEEDLSEENLQDLRSIMAEAQRAGTIVRNLLVFAHEEKGRAQPLALRKVVDPVVQLQEPSLRVEDIRVEVEEEESVPLVMANSGQIKQVLHNLLSNARYMVREAGNGGRIHIRIRRAEDGRVALDMEDTGSGIPSEVRSRIFTPFFTTKGPGEGTGLGLSISYGIMSEHGGELTAENWGRPPAEGGEPGEGGARFTMLLPALEDLPEEAGVAGAPREKQEGARVLVVDDEPALSNVLRRVLERAGHHAESVTRGEEALERLGTGRFDAIIVDLRMPGMSGPELFRRATERDPELESLFIFTSGDVATPDTQAFLNRTDRPYLSKPFQFDDLWRVLEEVLEGGMSSGDAGDAGDASA